MKVKLIAIAALGKNRQIGLRNELPWSIPDEYRHFQETVRGNHVLIGRKNFELHSGDIVGTTPLILTRNRNYKSSRGKVFQTLREVTEYADQNDIGKIYVIGGAEIYQLSLPYLSEFLWSEVDYDGPADAWFPEFLPLDWKQLSEEKHHHWTLRRLVKTPEKL